MAGTPRQKEKILFLLRTLCECTDADHAMTLEELSAHLEKEGICCERKSLYRDLNALENAGFRIGRVRTRETRYFWQDPWLNASDRLLLGILLRTGSAVSRKRKPEMKEKLSRLSPSCSRIDPADVLVSMGDPPVSEKVYSRVEFLCQAILSGKRIRFSYQGTVRDPSPHRLPAHSHPTVSPYRIVWREEYFLVGADEEGVLLLYRVDRMEDLRSADLPAQDVREIGGDLDFDLDQYIRGAFADEGEPVRMVFRISEHFLPAATRRFPSDTVLEPLDGGKKYLATCDLRPDDALFGWLLLHSDGITLLYPPAFVSRLSSAATLAHRVYEEVNADESGIIYDENGKTVDKRK